MKINIVLLLRHQCGKMYPLPKDIVVDVSAKPIPLLRERDSRVEGLHSRNNHQGISGTPGSGESFTYRGCINAFGFHDDDFYWQTLWGSLGLLKPGDGSIHFPIHTWEGFDHQEQAEKITYTIRSAESDMKDHVRHPSDVTLYLDIRNNEENRPLIDLLINHYGNKMKVVEKVAA